MIERIKKIIDFYNLTPTQFADLVEVSRPVISHILSGRNNPSLEVIQKISLHFPEVSTDWLLHEKGEMLRRNDKTEKDSLEAIPDREENFSAPEQDSTKKIQPGVSENQKADLTKNSTKPIKAILLIYHDDTFREIKPAT